MSILQRYVRHPAAGSGSWGDAGEPLDAGRWTLLRQNAVFLGQQNGRRHIAEHVGFRDFYRPAIGGTSFTEPPEIQQIPTIYNRKTGGSFTDLGVHWFHRAALGDTAPSAIAPFGTLVLRARWMVEGGFTAGAVLGISPGTAGPFAAVSVGSSRTTTTSASWADLTLTLPLTDDTLADVLLVPAAGASAAEDDYQRGRVGQGRIFFGAYCSSNTDVAGSRASVVNLSLHLSNA